MVWDALAGRFKQRTQEDENLGQEFKPLQTSGQSSGGASFNPTPNPTGGFGGQGGSTSGGPVSAGFVNYGDLYKANEEKAKGMAAGVYKGAEKKAEDAKKNIADAQKTFAEKAAANAGNWRPIGGKHGTRIESGVAPDAGQQKTTTYSGPEIGAWDRFGRWDATKEDPYTNQGASRDAQEGTPTRPMQSSVAPMTAGASRYASLYGAPTELVGWNPDMQESAADYHHSVRPLDAKSGAGQDYTGPKSLKESMGDEAYGKASDELKKAGDSITGLQDSGGIAEALGYAGDQTGNAAMDAGLTQTAGQSNFKKLAERYSNLGKTLDDAQTNSIADAGRADAASQIAAKDWQDMLDEYEESQKPAPAPDKKTGKGFPATDGDGNSTNAGRLLSDTGYTMTELAEIESELTPEERAYLYETSANGNPFGELYNWASGQQQSDAALHESIRAKLAKHRSKKQGGG